MINNEKLEALKDYILGGGSTEEAGMFEQLGTKKISVVDEYVAELRSKWPEQFGAPVEVEEEAPATTFWLMQEDKTLKELEIFKDKPSRVVFQLKEERDEVEIVIAGKLTKVDIIKLAKDPVTNGRKLVAAELAKG